MLGDEAFESLRFLPAACQPVPGIGRRVEMADNDGFANVS